MQVTVVIAKIEIAFQFNQLISQVHIGVKHYNSTTNKDTSNKTWLGFYKHRGSLLPKLILMRWVWLLLLLLDLIPVHHNLPAQKFFKFTRQLASTLFYLLGGKRHCFVNSLAQEHNTMTYKLLIQPPQPLNTEVYCYHHSVTSSLPKEIISWQVL